LTVYGMCFRRHTSLSVQQRAQYDEQSRKNLAAHVNEL
jgi:hypothetical protein